MSRKKTPTRSKAKPQGPKVEGRAEKPDNVIQFPAAVTILHEEVLAILFLRVDIAGLRDRLEEMEKNIVGKLNAGLTVENNPEATRRAREIVS